MNTEHDHLETIPAQRHLIEILFARGYLTTQTRINALKWLNPKQNWARWIAQLLLMMGTTFVLSGTVYFFAFNWANLSIFEKFSLVEIALLASLFATDHYGLNDLIGKLSLLSSSILVGVFLAVFGQIYQTGADSYQLFLAWAILISGWVVISNFAPLWFVFLVLLNLTLIFYWEQGLFVSHKTEWLLFSSLGLLNAFFLILREYGYLKKLAWLTGNWLRVSLVLGILMPLLVPTLLFIVDQHAANNIMMGVMLSLFAHVALFIYYRYLQPDLWVIATTILSICIIVETMSIQIIIKLHDAIGIFFFLTLSTIGIFYLAVIILRYIAQTIGNQYEK